MRNLKIVLLVGLLLPIIASADGIASLKAFYFETAFKNLFSIARAILLSSLIFAPLVLLLDKFHSSTNLLWKFSVSGVYGLLALITIIYIFDNENRKKR